jgi:hypothetical protein
MKSSQHYKFAGALLATTAIAGVASAGTVGRVVVNPTVAAQVVATGTALNMSNTHFSATAATANAVNFQAAPAGSSPAISFTNSLPAGSSFQATINIAGALMNNPALQVSVLARINNTASFVGTVAGACGALTPLTDKILMSNCTISSNGGLTAAMGAGLVTQAFMGGLKLSGMVLNNGSALATAGNSVSLSGTINDNAAPTVLIENITSGALITSAAPITTTVTPTAAAAVTNPATTPAAFKSLTTPNAGQISITLATVNITASGALGTNLATLVSPDGNAGIAGSSSVTVTVVSTTLSDDAALTATMSNAGATVTLTPAAFSTGTAAFSLAAAAGYETLNAVQTINVQFDGTNAINAASAGTVAVAYGISGASAAVTAAPAATGTTGSINSGGFSAELNTIQATGAQFASYIRVHNNGNQAGAVTFTVLNDADGTSMSTWTSGSIAVGATLQVSAADLETNGTPAITSPSGQYTVQLSGPILGYAQHILYDATTGQFADLSSFRNAGGANNP